MKPNTQGNNPIQKKECKHEWVDVKDPVYTVKKICKKCGDKKLYYV